MCVGSAFHPNPAIVFCHNALAHPQSHSSAFGSLRRVERLKKVRDSLRAHPGSIVSNCHFEPRSLLSRIHDIVHPKANTRAGLFQRVNRIRYQIGKDLPQFTRDSP